MTSRRDKRIAVVSLRHGSDVLGGAEAVLREAALGLHARGWLVEVLTTTATDLYSFKSVLPAGASIEDGLTVRRFTAVPPSRGSGDVLGHLIWSGARIDESEQLRWMNTGARSPDLFEYVADHADDYDVIICGPYHAWTAFVCAELVPHKVMLVPCLHDEPTARLEIFQREFEETAFLWFLSEPEQTLAARLYRLPRSARVMGAGVPVPARYEPDRFRAKAGINGPFLLYAGRREALKGWHQMLEHVSFSNDVLPQPLPVVTTGGGRLGRIPDGVSVTDLGFVPETEVADAFAAASAYVQPSRMESFSRTIMEAWLAQTLVIANARSAVVRWHCERSGAGLTYSDEFEFAEALRLLEESTDICARIANRGREYVLDEYTWDKVLDRVEPALAEL